VDEAEVSTQAPAAGGEPPVPSAPVSEAAPAEKKEGLIERAEDAVKKIFHHRQEAGDVGTTGAHGDLGSNAAEPTK
jgi:hypothetical protein